MANILDYIKQYKNETIQNMEFNEVDNLILSRLSYLPFENIKLEKQESLNSIAQKMKNIEEDKYNMKIDKELIKLVGNSQRFKDFIVTDYYFSRDEKEEKQFVAITIHLGDGIMYLSYGGTDNTLVGWKEDFNLSFMTHIPSQIEAVKYIKNVSSKYTEKMILGGHSKGGNLAVYSAVFCPVNIQERIISVTNFDGPGFDETVIENENYKRILNKIYTYIPQSSIIGRLLEHKEKYTVVRSTQIVILQHDIFSWEVVGNALEKMQKVTNGSDIINETVRNWLKSTSPEQRANFINIMYEIVTKTNVKTFKEFNSSKAKNIGIILKSYKNINENDKKMIGKMILSFFTAAKDCIMEKVI